MCVLHLLRRSLVTPKVHTDVSCLCFSKMDSSECAENLGFETKTKQNKTKKQKRRGKHIKLKFHIMQQYRENRLICHDRR